MLTCIRYIEVNFNFALVDCVRYKEDFVKSRICCIHFIVILAEENSSLYRGLRYMEFVKSRFHCAYFVSKRFFYSGYRAPRI